MKSTNDVRPWLKPYPLCAHPATMRSRYLELEAVEALFLCHEASPRLTRTMRAGLICGRCGAVDPPLVEGLAETNPKEGGGA